MKLNLRTHLCGLALVAGLPLAHAQFEKTYPTTRDRALRDVIRLSDGGYMLCGWSNVADPTECDVLLMRTDNNGNEVAGFPKLLGQNGNSKVDFAYSLVDASDGNYLILGYSYSYGGGDNDIVLWKVDINGNEVMPPKRYGGFQWDEGRKIIKCSDGNYVICGSTTVSGDQQACLIKIDKDGNTLWTPAVKTYGGPGKQFGNSVQELSGGGFLLVGQSMETDSRGDAFFVRTNANGDQDWAKKHGEPLGDEATGVVVNADGTFVACIRDSTGVGNSENINVIVKKFDASGEPVSGMSKQFGGGSKDTPKCMSLAKDGNYYVGVISRSFNWWGQNPTMDFPDMWLLKINAGSLDTIWSRHFGGVDHDHLEQAVVDPVENAILLCGHQVTQPYVKRAYFLKLNADGLVAALNIRKYNYEGNLSLFPNPGTGSFYLTSDRQLEDATLTVVNELGQEILRSDNLTVANGEHLELNMDGAMPGMYFVRVEHKGGRTLAKIIVQN